MIQCYNCIIIPLLHYKYPVLINTVPSYWWCQISDSVQTVLQQYSILDQYRKWNIIVLDYDMHEIFTAGLKVSTQTWTWHRLLLCLIYLSTWWGREVICSDMGGAIVLYHSLGNDYLTFRNSSFLFKFFFCRFLNIWYENR